MRASWCRVDSDFRDCDPQTKPVNSQIITSKFNNKKTKIKSNIILCYAHTNDANDEKKDLLPTTTGSLEESREERYDNTVGRLQIKVGADNTRYDEVMGTQGLSNMNENDERCADLCSLNQLVIGGSIYPHKRIHKATSKSPDHVTHRKIRSTIFTSTKNFEGH